MGKDMGILRKIKGTVEAYLQINREVLSEEEINDLEDQITFLEIQINNRTINLLIK